MMLVIIRSITIPMAMSSARWINLAIIIEAKFHTLISSDIIFGCQDCC
jgi:hypothetical protein